MSKRQPEKRKHDEFPETPFADAYYELPIDCNDMVNTFGTYNIQRTSDTGNLFPAIAQGMPDQEHIIENLKGKNSITRKQKNPEQ